MSVLGLLAVLLMGCVAQLIAVVKTWQDATVVLYVGVMMCFILACAFTFEIAFGLEEGNFSTISRAFMALFRMVRSSLSARVAAFGVTVAMSLCDPGLQLAICDAGLQLLHSLLAWMAPAEL